MIIAEQVSKYFGYTKAVDDISFTVKEGENLVLLGTSGCGKTTTLRMINRLTEPSAGNIMVNGESIMEQQPEKLRRSIGYVLQHNGLFPHYTVAENIAVVPRLLGMDKQATGKRTLELMEKLHLPPAQYLHAYPHELSGGQQQRVGLARALAADPPVLLMDEPFGALDTITRKTITREFSGLDEFKRKTIIMVTHDIPEAFALGDKICIMDKGKIMQFGTPEELLFHPANAFVADFLKEDKSQLAFRSVSVWRLWPFMPAGGMPAASSPPVSVSTDVSVWDAMEMLHAQNDLHLSSLAVTHAPTGETKTIGFMQLMDAVKQLKH